MDSDLKQFILKFTHASDAAVAEDVQELWSGYGKITRVSLDGVNRDSIIVKDIDLTEKKNSHPRGWNSSASYIRKMKSYEVEQSWYENYSQRCTSSCRVPNYLGGVKTDSRRVLILEDLDSAGFSVRKTALSMIEIKNCLKWLASFHALFMNDKASMLWEVGSYWHLETREEEFQQMEDGPLKKNATSIDEVLNNCKFRTIIHGDAKVANFCFSQGGDVAAIDFQYVGKGCGMKDVAYFLSSCLSSSESLKSEKELLSFYFQELQKHLSQKMNTEEIDQLETEWRQLYSFAWADFTRFLKGWSPDHFKLNSYSALMTDLALDHLKNI